VAAGDWNLAIGIWDMRKWQLEIEKWNNGCGVNVNAIIHAVLLSICG